MEEQKIYDLEERTAKFGEYIINFCKSMARDHLNKSILSQMIRSGTSVGANYMEANSASSKKDFRNKIYICKKEIQETKHWLRMIVTYSPSEREEAAKLWQEAQELTLIFQRIANSLNKK